MQNLKHEYKKWLIDYLRTKPHISVVDAYKYIHEYAKTLEFEESYEKWLKAVFIVDYKHSGPRHISEIIKSL